MDAKKRKDTTCSRLFVGVHELFSTIATFKGRQVGFVIESMLYVG